MVLSELMKAFIRPLIVFGILAAGVGCSSNPTNEPSVQAIEDANASRAAAIDNNPNYTPEQKAIMKQRMGLTGEPRGGQEKR
ncbi:MAG TPA: hypothetical protein VK934_02420 [Fimbriimonas sp.]|nr:hypothetical protein [Fimbriimonas sp.]